MLWLIPWIAVALGFGATSTFATYVAVVRLGLIERVVAFALRRGLRGLTLRDAAQGQPGYKVTRLKAGNVLSTNYNCCFLTTFASETRKNPSLDKKFAQCS